MNDNIYKKVAHHVTALFNEYPHENLVYHDLEHTENVVKHAQEIAGHYQLKDDDMLIVYIAAWFHDTGQLFAEIREHEDRSIQLMKEFMKEHHGQEAVIEAITGCIEATKISTEPQNLLQEILCDADTYHFGTKDFKKTNKAVKKEYKLRDYTTYTLEWEKNTLEMLEHHQFYTSYCQVLLNEGKEKNIERAKKKMLKKVNETVHPDKEEEDPTAIKQKNSLVARGIQTMLRLTSENHLKLSDMADGKANILISVNAIIISVILSVLMRKLEVDTYLTIPTIIFLVFSVVTIVISILATMPKVSEGVFSKDDVINKKTNLMFFGNFYKSSLAEYEWAMSILMKDKDYLYGSLIKDIYFLGKILGRKYKLIRLAYTVFMIGIITSVIAFTLASLLAGPTTVTIVTMPSNTPL